MKKLTYIIITLLFLNCKTEKKEVFQEYNGQMVKVEFSNSKANSSFTGFGGETYPNGNLKSLSYIKNGKIADTLFFYYEDGTVKEKGLIKDGIENGWWTYYRENGTLKEKIEWTSKGVDTIVKNQSLIFDNKGELKFELSSYFELEIPDTIQIGKNIARVKNYVSDFNDVDYHLLTLIIENQYSENEIKKDTFSDGTLKPFFGIFGYEKGKQIVRGKIEEKTLKTNEINKDSSTLIITSHYKQFEKEVYVTDSGILSTFSKKLREDLKQTEN